MNFRQSVPIVLGLIVVGVGAAALVHPQGLSGALGLASDEPASSPSGPVIGGAEPKPRGTMETELHKAHLIIDVQGKVAGLLGLSLEDGKSS